MSKTSLKLVYYYLYDVEESFTMDICTHPFNRPFYDFCTNLIFIHLSLRSQLWKYRSKYTVSCANIFKNRLFKKSDHEVALEFFYIISAFQIT